MEQSGKKKYNDAASRAAATAEKLVRAARRAEERTVFASKTGGEVRFTGQIPAPGAQTTEPGPILYLLGGLRRLFTGFRGGVGRRGTGPMVIVLSLLWLVLSVLLTLGIHPLPVRVLSFLTFAGGGLSGGLVSAAGGVLGKGLIAFFLTALLAPAASGGKYFYGLSGALKSLPGYFAGRQKESAALLVGGAGAALIGCNFMVGNVSLQNSMAAIAACLLSLRALSRKAGFLRGFVRSVLCKLGKGTGGGAEPVNRVLAGVAAGFALSVPLSAVGIGTLCYILGAAAVLVSAVLALTAYQKKEVTAG